MMRASLGGQAEPREAATYIGVLWSLEYPTLPEVSQHYRNVAGTSGAVVQDLRGISDEGRGAN